MATGGSSATKNGVGLILAAAGSGSRAGGTVPKQFLPFRGRPLYQAGLETLLPWIDRGVVVVPPDFVERTAGEVKELAPEGRLSVVAGGDTRQESVRRGLSLLPDVEWVLVHDAARPLVSARLVERVLAATRRWGACVPVVPIPDTVKEVRQGRVIRTLSRDQLALAQTPQGFAAELLRRALDAAAREGLTATDEATLAERFGEVHTVEGEAGNVKVTWPEDLRRLESCLAGGPPELRIGHGFDFHPFAPGRPLFLGGVEIPHECGLLGHSDADAPLHALMDALLGAAGMSDIGSLFPDSDERYRGVSSLLLLEKVFRLVRGKGFHVVNVDLTVLAERPRLRPHVGAMKANIARTLQIPARQVGIKATTMEGRGAIGRGEGIAAEAVALLSRS
jgi:2-C-methyl-D-erythritol 4-phosphate cytidylyltransferase/2-C-methyl-D-erythritol 2,4-cyclodiphosphate synthase